MTASDSAAAVRPSVYPPRRSRDFTLRCEVSGQEYKFPALPMTNEVVEALMDPTIPIDSLPRFGMTCALASALAGGALEKPGGDVRYGETLTLRMEAEG